MRFTILLLWCVSLLPLHAVDAWQDIENGALVVDLRPPDQFAAAHLPDSVNLPGKAANNLLLEMNLSSERCVIIIDNQHHQAARLVQNLRQRFDRVYSVGLYEDLLQRQDTASESQNRKALRDADLAEEDEREDWHDASDP